MRKLFITTMALIIGLAFSSGAFAEMKGMEPAKKKAVKMAQTEESHESKAVETQSPSSGKKMKKEHKVKKAKKGKKETETVK